MIICDICKKEITGDIKKRRLPYKKENTALHYKDMELCGCCDVALNTAIIKLQYDFYKTNCK